MSFLTPWAFALLALVPVILFFYLLKLRRRPMEVPSTLFWQRAVEDLTANAPFQRLKKNLLLYLQLLLLLLLALALARPLLNLERNSGRSYVVLIDCSASMLTREVDETRFDMAQEQLLELIDQMRDEDAMMIIAFARSATVAASFSNDKYRLRRAARGLAPLHEPSNIEEAFLLGVSLARDRKPAEILIVSDGAVEPLREEAQLKADLPVRFYKTGLVSNNVGFTRVDLRRAPESERDFQLFAEVNNFTPLPQSLTLSVYNEGVLSQSRGLELEPNGSASELFEVFFKEGEITLSLDADDFFSLDDQAFLTLQTPRETRVLLISPSNYFLEKAIRLDRDLNASLETLGIAAWPPDNLDEYDVVIFDTVAPDDLPPGNYLFLGAVPPRPGFERITTLASPPIIDWDTRHPVMREVNLADVAISEMLDVTLPPASAILASSVDDKPIIAFHSAENRNIVFMAFDLFNSNMPLRIAFPLFMSNSLNFLSRGKSASQAVYYQTGQTVELPAPQEVEEITVIDPTGERHTLERGELGTAFFDAARYVGFYEVEYDGQPAGSFGVNLLEENESAIEPRITIELGDEQTAEATKITKVNTEVWRWFALVALAILLIEWFAYHRRIGV